MGVEGELVDLGDCLEGEGVHVAVAEFGGWALEAVDHELEVRDEVQLLRGDVERVSPEVGAAELVLEFSEDEYF